ncbi:hypothetical protein [Streptomyces sp. NPDC050504]|uniref:hypothetical protein n=1 Tax=Streptomyces sp. NPDC050504 TaxID=3365618 RepID=UPI003799BAF1
MRIRTAVCGAAALVAVVAGCGVRPTGVIDAGESATGAAKGLRLYFVTENGQLKGVSRPEAEVSLDGALKLLGSGPEPGVAAEAGLRTLVRDVREARGTGDRVTVHSLYDLSGERERLAREQLVCTLARAQAVLAPKVRANDVQVTLKVTDEGDRGPFRCSLFLEG